MNDNDRRSQRKQDYARLREIYTDIQVGKAAPADIDLKFRLIQQLPAPEVEQLLKKHYGDYVEDPNVTPLMMKTMLAVMWHIFPDMLDLDKPPGPTH